MFCRTPPLLPPFRNAKNGKSNAEFHPVPDALEDITSLELYVTDFRFSVTDFGLSVTDPGFRVTVRVLKLPSIQGFGEQVKPPRRRCRILRVSKCRSAPGDASIADQVARAGSTQGPPAARGTFEFRNVDLVGRDLVAAAPASTERAGRSLASGTENPTNTEKPDAGTFRVSKQEGTDGITVRRPGIGPG